MERSHFEYLMSTLLVNKLSKEELDEFLMGLGENEMPLEYVAVLELHFNRILAEYENQNTTITRS